MQKDPFGVPDSLLRDVYRVGGIVLQGGGFLLCILMAYFYVYKDAPITVNGVIYDEFPRWLMPLAPLVSVVVGFAMVRYAARLGSKGAS
jgi:hypothetical protein